jgi:pimeloyl-ACP methyl ester carboxylesterase
VKAARIKPHIEVHDGNGPPALLVHGILSSRAQWLLNTDALREVCSPVVVELWGHGRSPLPDDRGAYEPDGYVETFEAIREALGADRWFVIGQSLGAALTLRYALTMPDRLIAHVFTNSNSAIADQAWRDRMVANAPEMARRIEAGGRDAVAAMPVHPRRSKRLPEPVRSALITDADAIEPRAISRAIEHTVPNSSMRDQIAHNRIASLLIVGKRERDFAEPRNYAAATMPMLDVIDLDAGHAVNIAAADGFNAAVVRFFEQCRRRCR